MDTYINNRSRLTAIAAAPKKTVSKADKKTCTKDEPVIRKLGASADFSITISGITRNEMRERGKYYTKSMKLPGNIDLYNTPTYSVVKDLTQNMSVQARKAEIMDSKYWEIIVDVQSLSSGPSDPSILHKVQELTPLLNEIQKLIVKITLPSNFITTKADYMNSPTRRFLNRLVRQLRACRSMKWMRIVLVLPKGHPGFESNSPTPAFPAYYVIPFYALRFRSWRIQYQGLGQHTKFLNDFHVSEVDDRNNDFWAPSA
ncbi:uncharacterized protein LY89DRAFT_665277 [Mollisia scopiformis]|uniref:Uncharacterized protein n=1 Tax=Mollisia scopiformis TaxID=149040 RepID=A0A194XPQ8_MOLSC|nr:uncharacterized protein LY89DRAFT_665277 [Mollisia scopiformis]KUJ22146.1 hypothetical protein LY89DRAFT_665277 [Mollisia scopiformis]